MLGSGALLLRIFSELHFITLLGGLCFYLGSQMLVLSIFPAPASPPYLASLFSKRNEYLRVSCGSFGRNKACRSLDKRNTKALSILMSCDTLIPSFLGLFGYSPFIKHWRPLGQRGLIPLKKKKRFL